MPIGIGTAALIGGGIAAAGTVGAAYLGSKSASHAASQANDVSQANNAANIGFMQQTYANNEAHLAPWEANGLGASNALTGLLLGTPYNPTTGAGGFTNSIPGHIMTGANGGSTGAPFTQAQIDAMWHDGIPGNAAAAQHQLDLWNSQHAAGGTGGTGGATGAPFTSSQIAGMWHDGIPGNAQAAQGQLTAWNTAHPAGMTPALGGLPAPAGAPQQVTSQAAFAALPSGAHFIAPDGTQRMKP